jgi:phosphatidate cytidylyltransferase
MSNLAQRVVTAVALGFIILGSILWAPKVYPMIAGCIFILGLYEFYVLSEKLPNVKAPKFVGVLAGLMCYVIVLGVFYKSFSGVTLTAIGPVLFSLVLMELWNRKNASFINPLILIFGIIYLGLPLTLSVILNEISAPVFPILGVMFILIWTNDTFAYFVGKKWGKTPLFERISPKKTWEGTLGGIVFTLVIALLIHEFTSHGSLLFWGVSGILISLTSIFGDLFESLLKRTVMVKDSGTILPGHGGILDRFDAALFSIPFFYSWYMTYFYW